MADPDDIATLWKEWREAETGLFAFLDSVDATDDAHTVAVRIWPKQIESPDAFAAWLNPQVRDDGVWSFATTRGDKGLRFGYALPVARTDDDPLSFMFVEVHTLLTLWWLTAAWRARQLATAAATLAEADKVIAAAACVRPLVETAAALWADGQRLAKAWEDIKLLGTPMQNPDSHSARVGMLRQLSEMLMGSKFDDRAPALKKSWGRVERVNVLAQVEKLAKVVPGSLQEDYQWLCNTVHPSLGNYLAFSAPPFMHETGTHSKQWFSGASIHVVGSNGVHADHTVESAIARAAATSLKALTGILDNTLRIIDDVALTTEAPALARDPYWRSIRKPGMYEYCPCRSGKKGKWCIHEWRTPAPALRQPYDPAATGHPSDARRVPPA